MLISFYFFFSYLFFLLFARHDDASEYYYYHYHSLLYSFGIEISIIMLIFVARWWWWCDMKVMIIIIQYEYRCEIRCHGTRGNGKIGKLHIVNEKNKKLNIFVYHFVGGTHWTVRRNDISYEHQRIFINIIDGFCCTDDKNCTTHRIALGESRNAFMIYFLYVHAVCMSNQLNTVFFVLSQSSHIIIIQRCILNVENRCWSYFHSLWIGFIPLYMY